MPYFIDKEGFLCVYCYDGIMRCYVGSGIFDNKFVAISGSFFHIVILDEDGFLWSVGENSNGQLGLGFIGGDKDDPGKVDDIKFKSVSCGRYHTIAIDNDGFLWGCGSKYPCGLGEGNLGSFQQISGRKFKRISCGYKHSMAIDSDGFLWGCGLNTSGQLGLGDNTDRNFFEKVGGGVFVDVRCGNHYTIAIDKDGFLWACGSNYFGSLGFGDRVDRNTFEKISDLKFRAVDCKSHAMGIDENNDLWVCGLESDFFQKVTDLKFSSISETSECILAIDLNGSLFDINLKGRMTRSGTEPKNTFTKIEGYDNAWALINENKKITGLNTKGAHK